MGGIAGKCPAGNAADSRQSGSIRNRWLSGGIVNRQLRQSLQEKGRSLKKQHEDVQKPVQRKVVGTECLPAVSAFVLTFLLTAALYLLTGGLTESRRDYAFSDAVNVAFSNADSLVDTLRGCLRRHDISITIRYRAEGEHLDESGAMVNELFSYAMENTDNPKEGDYIRYQYGGYTYSYSHEETDGGLQYKIRIVPNYYTTLEQELEVDKAVEEILDELNFHWYTTDAEKVQAIYTYLYDTVSYDTVRRNHRGYHLKTTAYAALIQHTAVCQGYCVALYRLLKEAGVDCRIITGMAEYEGEAEFHAWNLVCIDGLWYNVDLTWDKALETNQYYLKCDASFADHTREAEFDTEEFRESYPMAEEDYR